LPVCSFAQAGPDSGTVKVEIRAVSYQLNTNSKIDMKGTSNAPQAMGDADVQAKQGVTTIDLEVQKLTPATKFGAEFLTYVAWVVSPDGRASNIGELQLDNSGKAKLKATTALQTFSLFVSAEPYFAVRNPGELVVLANELRKDTKGRIVIVKDYPLIKRTQYERAANPMGLTMDLKKIPIEVYEARNAVEIAKSRGAEKYAPEIFSKADGGLKLTEQALASKKDKKDLISRARMTVQSSEDARALALQKQEEERIENERLAAAAKAKAEAEAKAAAEAAEAKLKADEEQARLKREAEAEADRQAEITRAREAQMKAEADAAALKAKMEADALRAKEEAAKGEADRARQQADALRAQLLDQFNRILETKDTPRGLVVTMADVLFDVGKFDVKPATREKLARLSGIVLAHQGLGLEIEGHTDSTGSDEINQTLSERRAQTVRDFMIEQGLAESSVSAKGFGKTMPIADNSTAAGRQQNRRVEIIVAGEVIGVKIGKN
jgi:outer membrane protein OmpA-like peptidoglycan-associated protein